MARERTIHLIDGSAQFYRAYFAIRGLSTSRGLPTNATYGFTTMLRKLYQDEQPERIGISFDLPAPTFRHEEYKEYKATRRKMDDELKVQLPYVRRVCEAFRLPVLELSGWEADDVIATLSRQAVEQGYRVVVVSGDKDLLQLVTDDVLVLNPGREGSGSTLYDRALVEEKFGVPPERVVDVLALVGDAVDNVPGVPGIGEKGARDLIREYGSLEAALENAEKVKRAAYRTGLLEHRDDAILSKRLVTLRQDVPVTLDLELLRCLGMDRTRAHALFTELEFAALAKEYAPEPTATRTAVEMVETEEALAAFVDEARRAGQVSLSLLRSAPAPMSARLVGIGLSATEGRALYVPLVHPPLEVRPVLPLTTVIDILRPLLADPAVRKLSARGKLDHILFARFGAPMRGFAFDVPLAAFQLNPARRSVAVEDLAQEHLLERPRPTGALLEGGATEASVDTAAQAGAQEADLVLRLAAPLRARLEEEGVAAAYEQVELPLVEVLADMERAGVKINREFLAEQSREMETQLATLTQEIYALAGGEFNIQSPIQLRDILFDRLGLKAGKKTAKTRASSTDEEMLEELAEHHELPRKILDYRTVQKLKCTYVDALPLLVNPETGRVHTTFHQTVAATGRLSVTTRTSRTSRSAPRRGGAIRRAFVPEPGLALPLRGLQPDRAAPPGPPLGGPRRSSTRSAAARTSTGRPPRAIFGSRPRSVTPDAARPRQGRQLRRDLRDGPAAAGARDQGPEERGRGSSSRTTSTTYPGVRRLLDGTVEEARGRAT